MAQVVHHDRTARIIPPVWVPDEHALECVRSPHAAGSVESERQTDREREQESKRKKATERAENRSKRENNIESD